MLTPRSVVPGIRWPGVASGDAAALLALQFQLERSQWWSPRRLRAAQTAQLGELLAHAWRHVPFYRERLREAGFRPRTRNAADVWQRLPLLTRGEVQEAGSALHARGGLDRHGQLREGTTAGSTGRPVHFLGTSVTVLFWRVLTLRDHLWHRRDLDATMAVVRDVKGGRAMPPHGRSSPGWGHATDLVARTGPAHLLNIHSPLKAQLEWLQRIRPAYLLSYPTNVRALARMALERGVRLESLREVLTISEALDPDTRTLVREAWGVPLTDTYSAREVGVMALQCPLAPHYHVQAESVLLEVLDDAGHPCAPGEVGHVVVTPLHNFAMPLIRYRIGDLAEVGEPCPCGRGLPVIRRVLGRVRNMLVLPNGERVWPAVPYREFAAIAPVRQHQLVQTGPGQIEVRLVVDAPLDAGQERAIESVIRRALGEGLRCTFSYPSEVARSPSGKFEEFVSMVDT